MKIAAALALWTLLHPQDDPASQALSEALSQANEAETYRKLNKESVLTRPIASAQDFVDLLKKAGLRIEGAERLVFEGRLCEGLRIAPRSVIERMAGTRKAIVLEGDTLRLLDIEPSLGFWLKRLSAGR